MSKRVQVYVIGLVCFLLGLLLAPHLPFARAQENKVKAPIFMHGMEVRSRKAGEADFNKDTKKWGIEVYKDEDAVKAHQQTEHYARWRREIDALQELPRSADKFTTVDPAPYA